MSRPNDLTSLAKLFGGNSISDSSFAKSSAGLSYYNQRNRAQTAEENLQSTKTPVGAISGGIALYLQRKRENEALAQLNQEMQAQQANRAERRGQVLASLPEDKRPIANIIEDDEKLAEYASKILSPEQNKGDLPSNVREYNYYSNLPENKKKEYLDVKRANPYESGYGRELGKNQAVAVDKLGNVVDNADFLINKVSELKQDKGLKDSVGIKGGGAMLKNIGINKIVPGTDAADFQAKFDQIGGGAFLAAYDTLRGTGQITEIEGEKATQAKSAMQTATSEKEFLRAADDFINVVNTAKQRAIKQAKGEFGAPTNPMQSSNNVFQSSNGVKFTIKR